MPISSRQIEESISILNFFPPNWREAALRSFPTSRNWYRNAPSNFVPIRLYKSTHLLSPEIQTSRLPATSFDLRTTHTHISSLRAGHHDRPRRPFCVRRHTCSIVVVFMHQSAMFTINEIIHIANLSLVHPISIDEDEDEATAITTAAHGLSVCFSIPSNYEHCPAINNYRTTFNTITIKLSTTNQQQQQQQ